MERKPRRLDLSAKVPEESHDGGAGHRWTAVFTAPGVVFTGVIGLLIAALIFRALRSRVRIRRVDSNAPEIAPSSRGGCAPPPSPRPSPSGLPSDDVTAGPPPPHEDTPRPDAVSPPQPGGGLRAAQPPGPTPSTSVAVSGSEFTGNTIVHNQAPVTQVHIENAFLGGAALPAGGADSGQEATKEELRAVKEEAEELKSQWERQVGRVVDAVMSPDPAQPHRRLLSVLSQEERALLGDRADHGFPLEEEAVEAFRAWRADGETTAAAAELCRALVERWCTAVVEVRFRASILQPKVSAIDSLPSTSTAALRDLACLTTPEVESVRQIPLSKLLVGKRLPQLRLLRAFLRRQHPEVATSLFKAAIDPPADAYIHFVHGVPPLPPGCVARQVPEKSIRRWLLTVQPRSLLRITGMGSAGKTTVATRVAGEALALGAHQVYWIPCRGCDVHDILCQMAEHLKMTTPSDASDAVLSARIEAKFKEIRDGHRPLVILDDPDDDKPLKHFRAVDQLLITCRDRSIGQNCCFEKIDDVEISGLTPAESESLLRGILRPEVLEDIVSNKMMDGVLKLCESEYNNPLSLNHIGSLFNKDHREWQGQGRSYLHTLKANLDDAKKKLEDSSGRIHTADYPYASVYAAVFASIQRLSDADRNMYRRLVVFGRGERIRAVSAAVLWEKEERKAKQVLESFCKLSLLTDLGVNKRQKKEYSLHDVLWDLMHVWVVEEERRELMAQCIRRYDAVWLKDEISDEDETFYVKYASWCLGAGMVDVALRCVCSLRYLMKRTQLGFTEGLLADFEKISAECRGNEKLTAYRNFVKKSLLLVRKDSDAEDLLRLALLRPREDSVFDEAKKMVEDGDVECPVLLAFRDSPCASEDLVQQLPVHSVLIDASWDSENRRVTDADDRGNGLMIIDDERICFFNIYDTEMRANFDCQRRIVLAKFIDQENVVVVSESESPNAIDCSILQLRRDETHHFQLMRHRRSRAVPVEMSSVSCGFENNFLWMLTGRRTVVCFSVRVDADFPPVAEFQCEGEHDTVAVRHCGQIAAVSSDETFGELLSVRPQSSRRLPAKGKPFCFFEDGKRLLLTRGEDCTVVDVSAGLEYHRVRTFGRPVAVLDNNVVCDWLFIVTYHSVDTGEWKKCFRLSESEVGRRDVCKDKIFTFPALDRMHVYSLREDPVPDICPVDAISAAPVSLSLRRRPLLSLEWIEGAGDFLAVFQQRGELHALLLLERKAVLSVAMADDEKPLVSVRAGRVAVASRGASSVAEFDKETGGRLQPVDVGRGRIRALCYSDRAELLVGVETQEGWRVLRAAGGREEEVLAVGGSCTLESIRAYGECIFCDELMVPEIEASRELSVWCRGRKVLHRKPSRGKFFVACDGRRVAFTADGAIILWDLLLRREAEIVKLDNKYSRLIGFTSSGTKLMFAAFTPSPKLYIVEQRCPSGSDVTYAVTGTLNLPLPDASRRYSIEPKILFVPPDDRFALLFDDSINTSIYLIDIPRNSVVRLFDCNWIYEFHFPFSLPAVSAGEDVVAVSNSSGKVLVFDLLRPGRRPPAPPAASAHHARGPTDAQR